MLVRSAATKRVIVSFVALQAIWGCSIAFADNKPGELKADELLHIFDEYVFDVEAGFDKIYRADGEIVLGMFNGQIHSYLRGWQEFGLAPTVFTRGKIAISRRKDPHSVDLLVQFLPTIRNWDNLDANFLARHNFTDTAQMEVLVTPENNTRSCKTWAVLEDSIIRKTYSIVQAENMTLWPEDQNREVLVCYMQSFFLHLGFMGAPRLPEDELVAEVTDITFTPSRNAFFALQVLYHADMEAGTPRNRALSTAKTIIDDLLVSERSN